MGLAELVLLALGLSMDAFAVAVVKGLTARRAGAAEACACGAYFGGFQALMPLIGYLLGVRFQRLILRVNHWIAFVLLALIGLNMLREAGDGADAALSGAEDLRAGGFSPREMLPLAVATSIDALAVGVTFAFLNVSILPAVALIGGVTFALSAAGVGLGRLFGLKWKRRAERTGGAVLILIGAKILIEHLLKGI